MATTSPIRQGHSYRAMDGSSARLGTPLRPSGRDTEDLIASLFDPSDCIDFMTCACILFPAQSVVNDDVELPIVRTTSRIGEISTGSTEFDGTKRSSSAESTEAGASTSSAYDLTSIVGESPIHFVAPTPRQYGMCPLGQEETIYFHEVTL